MRLERVTAEPAKMGGVPCIHGVRIPVATVVEMIAEGMSTEEILEAYPELQREGVGKRTNTRPKRSGRDLALRTGV